MLSIRLDKELEEALDRLALRLGMTRSALVRKVLRDYCDQKKLDKPKALLTFRLGGQHPDDVELYPDPDGMILVDANVLLYASDEGDARHEASLDLVERCRQGETVGAVTSGILAEFVAGLTWTRRRFPVSPTAAQAAAVRLMAGQMSLLPATMPAVLLFARLVSRHRLSGQDVHDAHHAALAIDGGCDVVATFDQDHWERFVDEGLALLVPR